LLTAALLQDKGRESTTGVREPTEEMFDHSGLVVTVGFRLLSRRSPTQRV